MPTEAPLNFQELWAETLAQLMELKLPPSFLDKDVDGYARAADFLTALGARLDSLVWHLLDELQSTSSVDNSGVLLPSEYMGDYVTPEFYSTIHTLQSDDEVVEPPEFPDRDDEDEPPLNEGEQREPE